MSDRIGRLGHLAIGYFATSRFGSRLHLRLYRLSGGRAFRRFLGCEIVLLTTVGRRTGRERVAPLVAVPDGDGIVVVASNAGRERAPGWSLNLEAEPHATVQAGPREWQAVARRATDAERDRLWPIVTELYAGYETYRRRASRDVHLVILEPDPDR
jgi:deazaflavin-dependent oxidoreductase (nitroreductase family)